MCAPALCEACESCNDNRSTLSSKEGISPNKLPKVDDSGGGGNKKATGMADKISAKGSIIPKSVNIPNEYLK